MNLFKNKLKMNKENKINCTLVIIFLFAEYHIITSHILSLLFCKTIKMVRIRINCLIA